MIYSKSGLVFGLVCVYPAELQCHLVLALKALKGSSGNKLKNELFPFVFSASA